MRYMLFFVAPLMVGCTGNLGQPDVPPGGEKGSGVELIATRPNQPLQQTAAPV